MSIDKYLNQRKDIRVDWVHTEKAPIYVYSEIRPQN